MYKMKLERHEQKYGPHFNEECAEKAVKKMINEDGTKGAHWSIEDTTSIANQYGINIKGDKVNKYDWYVVLNMIYSDFYKAVISMTNSNHIKYFVELAKAWINDKDIDAGKMWYYFKYIMCDAFREEDDDEYEDYGHYARRGGRGRYIMNDQARYHYTGYDHTHDSDDYDEDEYDDYRDHYARGRSRMARMSRY